MNSLSFNIHIRLWGGFVNRLISSATFPFMAIYLSNIINVKFSSIFLTSVVVLSFIVNVVSGYLIDRLPRKKVLIISSYSEAFSLLLLGVSIYYAEAYIFLTSYILYTLFSSFRRPSLTALIQDSVNDQNRELVFRIDYWLINLSLALGTFLGGILYENYKVYLFFAAFISTFTLSLIYTFFISETYEFMQQKKKKNIVVDLLSSYRDVLKDKRFVLLTLGMLILFSGEMSTYSYVAVRLAHDFTPINIFSLNVSGVTMFSYIGVINTLIVVLFTFSIEAVTKKINQQSVLIMGLLIYCIGYSINFTANIWWILVIGTIAASFGELIYAPITNSKMLDLIPFNKRGSYNAFYSLSSTGAEFVSRLTILLYPIVSSLVVSLVYFIILCIGSLIVYFSLYKWRVL